MSEASFLIIKSNESEKISCWVWIGFRREGSFAALFSFFVPSLLVIHGGTRACVLRCLSFVGLQHNFCFDGFSNQRAARSASDFLKRITCQCECMDRYDEYRFLKPNPHREGRRLLTLTLSIFEITPTGKIYKVQTVPVPGTK